MAATTADLVKEFVVLSNDIEASDEENDTRKEKLKKLEQQLLGRFERAAVLNMGVLGKTVYIRKQLWSKHVVDAATTIIALQKSGLDWLVKEKMDSSTLSAYVREVEKEHTDKLPLSCEEIKSFLPVPLQAAIDVTQKITLHVRR